MSSILSKLINLAGNITGTLGVGNGGTGVTSSTGTGSVVLSTSPTLVTPALGTPASGTLTNCTGYPVVVPGTSAGLVPGVPSRVWVQTASGFGSTNTFIRRWTTTVESVGSDITYADSATLGGSFTINTTGLYSISFSDVVGSSADVEVTRNTTGQTTGSSLLIVTDAPSSAAYITGATIVYLSANDVIRLNVTPPGAATNNNTATNFRIVRIY